MELLGWLAFAGLLVYHWVNVVQARLRIAKLNRAIKVLRASRKKVNKTRNRRKQARRKKSRLVEQRGSKCEYCSIELPVDELTVDHYKPIASGGSSNINNLRLACHSCNKNKSDQSPEKWEKRLEIVKVSGDSAE